jgi:hypothetical protein
MSPQSETVRRHAGLFELKIHSDYIGIRTWDLLTIRIVRIVDYQLGYAPLL